MRVIETTVTVTPDGSVLLDEPLSVPAGRHRMMLLVDEQKPTTNTHDQLGWPTGFFEETYGSLAGDPLTRPEQGELQEREALE